ncbi:arginine-tRNA-protein transferase [Litorimonas taeanensis]|uniref:Aspartate/glutamate leucyltransferase n=1 Tax=Litorimonas taeanensis TaxID=568099 RepID=A0A420WKF6_9PROT|nr:arginyltransferase [Litorimonas taeanensis]RKQ71439.1 arginine-tRNA-protein transferase [Litorimonas taeanensis]
MSHVFDPNRLQFYLTIPGPCPYLPGRIERKIFTQLDPLDGPHLNNYLTHAGFRRSQNVIYRPACESCRECRSLRVDVIGFETRKRFRRIKNRNNDLSREIKGPIATKEQFNLLKQYLTTRHIHGGMADMDFARYEMMVEDCASETEIVEYRLTDGHLVAAILIDRLMDGHSLVYSFFDTQESKRSLGLLMILDQIERCKTLNFPYLYLGYWVPGSTKMDYKSDFQPCEVLSHRGWIPLDKTGY